MTPCGLTGPGLDGGPIPLAVMSTQSPVAASAMLISLALAATILERWIDRRRPQDLAWAASFGLFAAGSGALWWGASTGWSPGSFRAFYAFGAVLNVPILALGTIYLLFDRRVADRITVVTVLACTFAAGVVMAAPLTGPLADHLALSLIHI